MFIQSCIIKAFGLCRLVRFGNESWAVMAFAPYNEFFPGIFLKDSESETEHEIGFDFSNRLSVI
ncbi:hypothetical protein [Desulfamplus magnetovallimortis]|uniref:hypothetical protein n=1 Tax=Desulfamplus magnetovallimortis TaxID=1246637 RepID=UPI0009BC61A8|nr:hypothetical protein [Desulfamplus magnetovallimortis]